jgi:hypothetical protein
VIGKAVSIYSAFIFLMLFSFGMYQIWSLGVKNIASNEEIRERWNGNGTNKPFKNIY